MIHVELMQFSAILLMTLLALKLFLLPKSAIASAIVRKSRLFLFIGTSLLAIQFLLQYVLGWRAREITYAIMLNLAFFIPCSVFFSLAVLYLQRHGHVNFIEKYIGVPVWCLAMAIMTIGIVLGRIYYGQKSSHLCSTPPYNSTIQSVRCITCATFGKRWPTTMTGIWITCWGGCSGVSSN